MFVFVRLFFGERVLEVLRRLRLWLVCIWIFNRCFCFLLIMFNIVLSLFLVILMLFFWFLEILLICVIWVFKWLICFDDLVKILVKYVNFVLVLFMFFCLDGCCKLLSVFKIFEDKVFLFCWFGFVFFLLKGRWNFWVREGLVFVKYKILVIVR